MPRLAVLRFVVDPQYVGDVSYPLGIDSHERFGMTAATEGHAPANVVVVQMGILGHFGAIQQNGSLISV